MTDISQDRWNRIEALVDRALELPTGERAAFLNEACGDDESLRKAADKWLAACDDPALFPDTPAAVFAAQLLTTGARSGPENDGDIPDRIGHYRFVREIGRGGMGAVYLAERDDGELDRRVAVKLMRRGTGDDATLRRRFRDERQILARLDHEHIATLIDGGVTPDGRLYFVMQYIEGAPIDKYCDEQRLLIDERLRLFLDVCEAVHHAHRHQIVHRDLKPGNILVAADGKVKLLDFGIAKLLEPAAARSPEQTRTGERLLTPEYASPEQIRGEPVTPASDVHALGVLLHRMLTGQRPFRRKSATAYELERAILDEDPTQPSDVVSNPVERRRLRGDLDAIVLTALRKDPAQRYANAGALADDIERHLSGRAVRARGRAPAYRLRAFASRHRVVLAAAAAGAAMGAAVLGVAMRNRPAGTTNAVLAIGRIADYRDGTPGGSVAPLVDMLATNLARTQGLTVVSAGRMSELVHQAGNEPAEEAYTRAARHAGATEVLNGAIYSTPSGVRIDLQRVSVSTGTMLGAHTASGTDLFALADSATFQLVQALGLAPPSGSISDVTTRSLAAYQLYTEGLRHFYAGETAAADSAFGAALREDSTFAMAAFYYARNSGYQWRFASATTAGREDFTARTARALRLSANASDRERLMIRTYYETFHLSPSMRAFAETLAVRYPQEIDGHLVLGLSLVLGGDPLAAIPRFNRILVMDSASLHSGGRSCAACLATDGLLDVYIVLDSLSAAERLTRQWLLQRPSDVAARGILAQVLDAQRRYSEAAAQLAAGPYGGSASDSMIAMAKHWIKSGALSTADSALRVWIGRAQRQESAPLLYFHAIVLRNQRRFDEALVVARRLRVVSGEPTAGAAPPSALVEAQVLFERGQFRAAAALFDSVARWSAPGQPPSAQATLRTQALAMAGASLHAGGDTTHLSMLADSLERDGQRVLMFRPRDQHHFVRGLMYEARGDDAAAVRSLERALASVASDFGRANIALADIHMKHGRAREAIAVLVPVSRGWFMETTNLHMTLREVYERLARAYEMAGQADSAAVWRVRS